MNIAKKVLASLFVLAVCMAGCANKKVGDACETYRSSECGGPGGTCLANSHSGNYCSITCNAPTDCPSGFICDGVTSMSINGKGEKTGEKVVKMCVKS